MAYSTRADLEAALSESDLLELASDSRVWEDLHTSVVWQFQVDTASTSGHFENESGTAVTVGPGNTAERVKAGVQFQIADTWYEIDSVTGDGSADDAVAFTGTLAAGTYTVDKLEGADVSTNISRAIDVADNWIDELLSSPSSFDTGWLRDRAVEIAIGWLFERVKENVVLRENDFALWAKRKEDAIAELRKQSLLGGDITMTNFDRYYEDSQTASGFVDRFISRSKASGL